MRVATTENQVAEDSARRRGDQGSLGAGNGFPEPHGLAVPPCRATLPHAPLIPYRPTTQTPFSWSSALLLAQAGVLGFVSNASGVATIGIATPAEASLTWLKRHKSEKR